MVLGRTYKDKITGLVGVCTGVCTYISGCTQALIAPRSKDGKSSESVWFDTQRLDWVKGKETITLQNEKTPGFDRAAPTR